MLITETLTRSLDSFLNRKDILSILENSTYLDENDQSFSLYNIPIFENKRLGINTVFYEDIENLDQDINNTLQEIANINNIDKDSLGVVIEDYKIIMDPSIVKEIPNYVIKQVSENSIESTFVESCLYNYIESGNEEYFDIMCNPECLLEEAWNRDRKYYDPDKEIEIYKRILYYVNNYFNDTDSSEYGKSWHKRSADIKSALGGDSIKNKIMEGIKNSKSTIPIAKSVINKLMSNDKTKSFISSCIKDIPNQKEPVKINGVKIDHIIRSNRELGSFEKIRRELGVEPLSRLDKKRVIENLRSEHQTSGTSYRDQHNADSVYGDKPKLRKYDSILGSIIKKKEENLIYMIAI